mmetsp:Transcript_4233/g.7463  ORF Transcript_4233/g.7463 Transcript_4233/m.7463 type:complete len:344 (+) Transcript_4233:258-1289(+)
MQARYKSCLETAAMWREQMRHLALRTDVVATTAGPYALYGSTLLEACAATGTSYCDLTGEIPWVELMHEKHHKTAEASGAHIVPTAGFDSVPSDLGTFLVAQKFKDEHGEDCDHVHNYVTDFQGGFQGGTVNSLMHALENPQTPLKDGKEMPVLGTTTISWTKALSYDRLIGKWTFPFFMTPTNAKVVHRSNAQLGYNPKMTYGESMADSLPKALAWSAALISVGSALLFPPTRSLVRKYLPQSGEGPSRETMENGRFSMVFVASKGDKETRISWDALGDPSYIATTIYMAETAITLAENRGALSLKGGVLTPVSACGNKLWERISKASWERDGAHHVTLSKC